MALLPRDQVLIRSDTATERDDHVKTQGADGHLHTSGEASGETSPASALAPDLQGPVGGKKASRLWFVTAAGADECMGPNPLPSHPALPAPAPLASLPFHPHTPRAPRPHSANTKATLCPEGTCQN